jgi:putative tricarboxylic transport membrane protein
MAQGLLPGPLLFVKHADTLYGFFALLLITNIMLLVFGYFAIRYLRRIALIPQAILFPAVTAICFAGSFAVNSSFFDILIMVAGGFIGYLMRKTDIPIPPLVIAMLLAPGLENAMRQSLLFSDNDPTIFVSRPISGTIFALLAMALIVFSWKAIRTRPVQKKKGE